MKKLFVILKFFAMLSIAAVTVSLFLPEKKQNKAPERVEAISWEMKVSEKDQLSYLPVAADPIIRKKVSSIISLMKETKILNSDIQEMVDLVIELNGISKPDLIHPGQLLLCRFPDNKNFEFLEEVLPGQSLWSIVKNLLVVTYRPVYYSHSKLKK